MLRILARGGQLVKQMRRRRQAPTSLGVRSARAAASTELLRPALPTSPAYGTLDAEGKLVTEPRDADYLYPSKAGSRGFCCRTTAGLT